MRACTLTLGVASCTSANMLLVVGVASRGALDAAHRVPPDLSILCAFLRKQQVGSTNERNKDNVPNDPKHRGPRVSGRAVLLGIESREAEGESGIFQHHLYQEALRTSLMLR